MAVQIEFKPDDLAVSGVSATDPESWFHVTILFVPVRFRVDGRDMFPDIPSPMGAWSVDGQGIASPTQEADVEGGWALQPLIGFLVGLEHAIHGAIRDGTARYSPEAGLPDMTFDLMEDGALEVATRGIAVVAGAPFEEFSEALAHLRRSAHDWLAASAPQLAAHPNWTEWFPSG